MSKRTAFAAAVATLVFAGSARAQCRVDTVAELPVRIEGSVPLLEAELNGQARTFVLDTAAAHSLISPAGAKALGLKLEPAPYGLVLLTGDRRERRPEITRIKALRLGKAAFPDVTLVVGGGEPGGGALGVLGDDFLSAFDVEFDLGSGMLRLTRPSGAGCATAGLAYWAGKKAVSVVALEPRASSNGRLVSSARVNGKAVGVMFDTSVAASILSLAGAENAGLTPTSDRVVAVGDVSGYGPSAAYRWIGPLKTFELGEEVIYNGRVSFGGFRLPQVGVQMILGLDFFLSHRIYLSRAQNRLFFTYGGGPVFDVRTTSAASVRSTTTAVGQDASADPEALGRAAAADAARGVYADALGKLDRAIAAAPTEARYRIQRARVRTALKSPADALADYDAALARQPTAIDARLERAELRMAAHDEAGARTDLDAAAAALAPDSETRYALALEYRRAHGWAEAARNLDLWIASHPQDRRQGDAVLTRCLVGGEGELARAEADCDAAVAKVGSVSSQFFPYRDASLVARAGLRIRRGRYDAALSDVNAVLVSGTQPDALYLRGVARARKGDRTSGDSDKAAAVRSDPNVRARLEASGLPV